MKGIIFSFLLICATGAFGQSYLSNEPAPITITDHPGHAEVHAMAKDQNVWGPESPYTFGKGEIPLREVARASTEIPLGDVARKLRKEHVADKKATILWENN